MSADNTFVGKKPAGARDELELILRFATALYRGRVLPLSDREVTYAVSELLDRANFVLESTVDITILAGAKGVYMNGKRFDVEPKRRELAEELMKGFPQRGLAGVTIASALDQSEVLSFLAAWRLPPSKSTKESLARLNEVMSGERAGRGLSEGGPIQLVKLPASGELPLPANAPLAAPVDEDDDYTPPSDDDGLTEQQATLARMARRAKDGPKPDDDDTPSQEKKSGSAAWRHGVTAVKNVGEVFVEDTRGPSGESAVRRAASKTQASDPKNKSAVARPDAGKSSVRSDASKSSVRSDASKSGVRPEGKKMGPSDSRSGDERGKSGARKGPSGSRSGDDEDAGPSWLTDGEDEPEAGGSSWVEAAREPGASRSGENADTGAKPARRDTNDFKSIAEALEMAALENEKSGSSTAVRPPGSSGPGAGAFDGGTDTSVRKLSSSAFFQKEPEPKPEASIEEIAGSTAVRPVGDMIGEDVRARASAMIDDDSDSESEGARTTVGPVRGRDDDARFQPPVDEAADDDARFRPPSDEPADDDARFRPPSDEAADDDARFRPPSDEPADDDARFRPPSDEPADEDARFRPPAEASDDEDRFRPPADDDESRGAVTDVSGPGEIEDLSPEASKAQLAYARLCGRALRALTAVESDRDRAVSALRRAVVEILNGLAHTAYEDRLLALTAAPAANEDARAQHAANTAILTTLTGRACGIQRLALADLALAAALHDEGDVEAAAKPDAWPRGLVRAVEGTVSDASLLRAVLSYERAGAAGVVARPSPQQSRPRLESRIVACACAFDAATRGNEQRAAAAPDLALQRLGPQGHDPIAVKGLTAALGKFPRGLLLLLEPRGELAIVLACGGRRGDKPRVRVVADRNGQPISVREIELGSAKDTIVGRVESPAKVAIEPLPHLLAWG